MSLSWPNMYNVALSWIGQVLLTSNTTVKPRNIWSHQEITCVYQELNGLNQEFTGQTRNKAFISLVYQELQQPSYKITLPITRKGKNIWTRNRIL